MNYYPTNFYSNYPQQQMQYSQPLPQTQAPQVSGLSGKIVDSVEVARVADIPFGGYGVFPKADLSEIYIKSWNSNGTTSIITYKPVIDATPSKEESMNERISSIEKKIEELLSNNTKRKELSASAY